MANRAESLAMRVAGRSSMLSFSGKSAKERDAETPCLLCYKSNGTSCAGVGHDSVE